MQCVSACVSRVVLIVLLMIGERTERMGERIRWKFRQFGSSGTLLDFDVSWEDIADNSYVEIAETIITDKDDDEYDDFIENSSFASSIQIAYANGLATVTGSVSGVTVTTNGAHVTVNL